MISAPNCCAAPRLTLDARFVPQPGPVSTRVAVCRACGALWIEEWMVLWVGDGERDDLRYERVSAEEAARRFRRA